jgi:hypothetical protein
MPTIGLGDGTRATVGTTGSTVGGTRGAFVA